MKGLIKTAALAALLASMGAFAQDPPQQTDPNAAAGKGGDFASLDANGDGFVSAADPRFGELLLWSDHDGDRRSTHWEHESLAARGVVAIPIDFTRERTCDDRGNCAIERALVELKVGDATLVADVVDVHLACQ